MFLYIHNFRSLYKQVENEIGNTVLKYYGIECHSTLCKYCHWWSKEIGGQIRLKLTAALLIMPIALDDLWPFYPHPRDGIPATLHVILLDKTCFFLWHFWYIACLPFIKLFNITRTSTTVDYVTQLRTCYGEHLNEHFYEAPYLFIFDPKTHIRHLFSH